MKPGLLLIAFILFVKVSSGQVFISTYASSQIGTKGFFKKTGTVAKINLTKGQVSEASRKAQLLKWPDRMKSGIRIDSNFSILAAMNWETIDNMQYGRARISVPGALRTRFYLSSLTLSKNSELYVYNDAGTRILGPITQINNIKTGRLWGTSFFEGDNLIFEIKVPVNNIDRISVDMGFLIVETERPKLTFRDQKDTSRNALNSYGFGDANACTDNVLCSPGNPYANERNAVCLIQSPGGDEATGFLINDVCNSKTPYLLTAYHFAHYLTPSNFLFTFKFWSPYCTAQSS